MADEERYGAARAVNELTAIFEAQWANGLLPHIRFMPGQSGYRPDAADWGVTPQIAGHARIATSGITQPPIVGLCALTVFRNLPDPSHYMADFLTLVSGLERFHHFLLTQRDPTGDGLVSCFHPWETGTDNSPAFEPLLVRTRAYMAEHQIPIEGFGRIDNQRVRPEHRPTDKDYSAFFGLMALFKQQHYDQARIGETTPFLLQDVLFNSLLVGSLHALAGLEDELASLLETSPSLADEPPTPGLLRHLSARNRQAAGQVTEAIRVHLWSEDDGLFYARDARRGERLPVPTVSSLMPLLGDIATPKSEGPADRSSSGPGHVRDALPGALDRRQTPRLRSAPLLGRTKLAGAELAACASPGGTVPRTKSRTTTTDTGDDRRKR